MSEEPKPVPGKEGQTFVNITNQVRMVLKEEGLDREYIRESITKAIDEAVRKEVERKLTDSFVERVIRKMMTEKLDLNRSMAVDQLRIQVMATIKEQIASVIQDRLKIKITGDEAGSIYTEGEWN